MSGTAGALDEFGVSRTSEVPIGGTAYSNMLAASYTGEHVFFLHIRVDGKIVRTLHFVVLGHGGGSCPGQHAAMCHMDALGLQRAAVGDVTLPDKFMDAEDYVDLEELHFIK